MLSPVNRFGGERHSRIVRSIRAAAHIVCARTIKARAPRAGMASMEDEYLHAATTRRAAGHGQLTNAALDAWFGAFEEPPRMSSERDTCRRRADDAKQRAAQATDPVI